MKPLLYRLILILLCTTLAIPAAFAQSDSASSETINNKDYRFHFSSIGDHMWGDLTNTFWGLNGIIFIWGMTGSLMFLPADHDINDHFVRDPLFSQNFDDNIGLIFSPYTLGGASLLAFLTSTQVDNPTFSLATESLVESWIGSTIMIGGAKLILGRTRPNGNKYAVPSAHAGAAFSTATVLTEFYGWKVGAPSYALASFVAFSRMDGHYHFLTDVLIGSLIGTVFGMGTSQFHKKENPTFFITPQISSNEVGLTLYKSF